MAKDNNEVVMESIVQSEAAEKAVSKFIGLPDKCKNFILGYIIGVQQSRREKRSA